MILVSAFRNSQASDLVLPLEQVAEGFHAMDERRAIKTLLVPNAVQRQ